MNDSRVSTSGPAEGEGGKGVGGGGKGGKDPRHGQVGDGRNGETVEEARTAGDRPPTTSSALNNQGEPDSSIMEYNSFNTRNTTTQDPSVSDDVFAARRRRIPAAVIMRRGRFSRLPPVSTRPAVEPSAIPCSTSLVTPLPSILNGNKDRSGDRGAGMRTITNDPGEPGSSLVNQIPVGPSSLFASCRRHQVPNHVIMRRGRYERPPPVSTRPAVGSSALASSSSPVPPIPSNSTSNQNQTIQTESDLDQGGRGDTAGDSPDDWMDEFRPAEKTKQHPRPSPVSTRESMVSTSIPLLGLPHVGLSFRNFHSREIISQTILRLRQTR